MNSCIYFWNLFNLRFATISFNISCVWVKEFHYAIAGRSRCYVIQLQFDTFEANKSHTNFARLNDKYVRVWLNVRLGHMRSTTANHSIELLFDVDVDDNVAKEKKMCRSSVNGTSLCDLRLCMRIRSKRIELPSVNRRHTLIVHCRQQLHTRRTTIRRNRFGCFRFCCCAVIMICITHNSN